MCVGTIIIHNHISDRYNTFHVVSLNYDEKPAFCFAEAFDWPEKKKKWSTRKLTPLEFIAEFTSKPC